MVKKILEEFNLEIDDVRWYLASLITESILSCKDNKNEIIKMIWSGKLEAEIYNMEEVFINKLDDEYSRDIKDESVIREIIHEISKCRKERYE